MHSIGGGNDASPKERPRHTRGRSQGVLPRRFPTEAASSVNGRVCRDTCDEEPAEPSDGIVVWVCCQFDQVGRLMDGSHRGIVRPTSARCS
jgi:hypothetical protein